MATLTINSRPVDAIAGTSILEAARSAGITIPTLCYHPDLSTAGSCRLCLVEVEGVPCQVPACSHPTRDGMAVHTETPAVVKSRRMVLELLLRRYDDADHAGGERDETEFQHWLRHYGVVSKPLEESASPARPRHKVDSDPNPFVLVDLNKCILCTRCVRACEEVQGRFVWGIGYRGTNARIIAGASSTMLDARCESCGACAAYCPTGALDDKMSVGLGKPDRVVSTICGYCGVGCGLDLNVKNNRIIRVTSNPAAPVNGMSLCVKGRYGYDFVHHPDRLTRPRVRRYLLDGGTKRKATAPARDWVDVDWKTALELVADRLTNIKRESGPDAIGILSSAKCTNEENYLMQKFARQVIGTHNIDHCARLCHASTVAGLAMAFGSGAMSNSMADVAGNAQAIFIIGSNITEQHPVFGAKIRQAVLQRGVKLVVADPRKVDITEFAELHLRHRPGTDVALINGLMHLILANGWQDQHFIDEHCEGFDDCRATLQKYTPEDVAAVTGVLGQELRRAAEILARHKPMAVIWAMGITQHTTGVLNVLSLANLQMLLGNMGVPGGGVNPLRGQNNVQGACDMGCLPNVFPGYQAVSDAKVRENFRALWATGTGLAFSDKPGLTVTEMVEAFGTGRLRGLYVLAENLAMTEPDVSHTRHCLERGELLVLQEIFPSETAAFADVLLPGATFAETSGTYTNTERRIQLLCKAIESPGQARADWAITAELAGQILACEERMPTGPSAGWDYADSAQILDEVARVTPSYAGVNAGRLERGEQLEWPVPSTSHPGTPILHVGHFARGRGKFHAIDHLPAAESPDAEFPFVLTTGRVLYHWHGGEQTRRSRGLLEVCPEAVVEVSPDDAARIGLDGKSRVRICSRRGEVVARAVVTDRVAAGVVFGNFHFPGPGNINNLTIEALDPVAKIPEYKVCAVAIEALV